MFGRHRGKSHSPFSLFFTLFRLVLSIVILGILIIGIYSAYKSFSGVDPLKISPQAILKSDFSSDKILEVIKSMIALKPKESLDKAKDLLNEGTSSKASSIPSGNVALNYKFAVVTDSHNDNENLAQAINKAQSLGAEFVVGLGDYTDVGTVKELQDAKEIFENSGFPYYLTAGDHDLWDSRNRNLPASKNFSDVFGAPYQSFGFKDGRFILLFNSDNYLGLDPVQVSWFEGELEKAKENSSKNIFVFLSIPLFHPSSDHVMGKTEANLKNQAEHLIDISFKAGVSEIIAGDVHFYSRFNEPKTGLKMTVVGALTDDRNTQNPRFVMVDVYEDGSYNMQDIEIK